MTEICLLCGGPFPPLHVPNKVMEAVRRLRRDNTTRLECLRSDLDIVLDHIAPPEVPLPSMRDRLLANIEQQLAAIRDNDYPEVDRLAVEAREILGTNGATHER